MELLEEDLTCPICCGILEGNTRNVIWRPSPFKCPTCRKETTVTGVNNLQVNYSLKGIVEKYNKIKISTKMPVCKVHSGQPLNIFCQTDTQLICGICATRGDHIKHLFCSIEDAYCQEKRAFETLSQVFEAWHCGDALSRLATLETSKRKALQMLTKDYDRVKDFFEKLQYTLEQKKNEILSDFETMKLAVMQAYDPEINKLNTIIQEQQTVFNIAETFKGVSEPILFLQQMQEFREKIKVIKEIRLYVNSTSFLASLKVQSSHHHFYSLITWGGALPEPLVPFIMPCGLCSLLFDLCQEALLCPVSQSNSSYHYNSWGLCVQL
uniref:Tripartite motif containing 13 n=1 Tax=Naja naja TaxID=35670 RepID=A0A8C6X8N0_NAJNA